MEHAAQTTDSLPEDLARVARHHQAGRYEAAVDLTRKIDADRGPLAETQHLRGLAIYAMGDKEAGLDMIRDAATFLPENGGVQSDIGALLAQEGKYEDALPYFEEATRMAPHYAGAWTNLGAVHFMMQDYPAAVGPLRKAVKLDPKLLDAQRNLGTALVHAHRFKEAIAVFFQALSIDPNDVGLHLSLSGALYRDERHDTALYHANRALELRPNTPQAHLHIGNALASLGRMDEAEDHLLKASSVLPGGIGAINRLIHLRKTKPDSPELERLQRLLALPEDRLPDRLRASLHFAAGKAFRDLEDYPASFQHLQTANALTAAEHSFDQDNHIAQVDRMIEVVTPELVARLSDRAGVTDVAPIFVCGMPRSGTTLTELMLSRHSQIQAGGELNASRVAFGQVRRLVDQLEERDDGTIEADDLTRVGEFYVEALRQEGLTQEFLTDKLPINYLYVGLLSLALPRAKFVILDRHPMDCCLSNWSQDFGRNQPFSTRFEDLGVVYRQYRRISDYWAGLLPEQVHILAYQDIVEAPKQTMQQVLDFVGLGWEDAVLDHAASTRAVNTASIAQVRQPLYRSSVAKWRKYGALLKPLAAELADLLDEDDRRAAGLRITMQ